LRLTLTDGGERIDAESAVALLGHGSAPAMPAGQGSTLHAQHCAQVVAAYEDCGRNVSKTARALGVSRNTVYRVLAERGVRC
jgi:transcriptional regulator of acetoin/glycerol metabolism